MAKNIIVCSDGTGNTSIKGRGTNVFKIYEAIDLGGHRTDPQLMPQVALYDDGVGTEEFKPLRIFAGMTGWGLSRNVTQLYRGIVRIYDPGDRIFLFGFSRGAFTVRTLGGLIGRCGIVNPACCDSAEGLDEAVETAYRVYRKCYRTTLQLLYSKPDPTHADAFKKKFCHPEGRIAFIGVWDTVDAVGLPFHASDVINSTVYRFKFPDHKLSGIVDRACHALAIDDERHSFHPVLWDEEGETTPRIQQVWFAGAHSNVGGGYPKQGMSLVALDWMMTEAEHVGLRFNQEDRAFYRSHANYDDKLYDPRAGLGIFYRWKPRDIEALCTNHHALPKLHASVVERIAHGTERYAPGNLPGSPHLLVTDLEVPEHRAFAQERAKRVEDVVRKAHAGGNSLLNRIRKTIATGQLSYYLYVTTCVVGLIALARLMQSGSNSTIVRVGGLVWNIVTSPLTTATEIGRILWQNPLLLAGLVAGLGMSYLMSVAADRRMTSVFAEFWHDVHPRLREALKGVRKSATADPPITAPGAAVPAPTVHVPVVPVLEPVAKPSEPGTAH